MSIKIKIGKQAPERESQIKLNINVRKTLDGNLIIGSHEDVDIVLLPEKSKVLILSKDIMDDKVYNVQNRLMKILSTKGVIDPATIHSGNIYGSMEAVILPSEEVNSTDVALLVIARWIDSEKPHFSYRSAKESEFTDRYTDPDEDESTELGEIPHDKTKSSIRSGTHGGFRGGQMPFISENKE